MKTLGRIALFLVSFVVSALAAYYWWLKDWPLVWILMASIFLHEVGHWLAFVNYGLKPSMFFIPLLGAAVVVPKGAEKLNHKQLAIVALAGSAVNFALFLLGLLISLGGNKYGMNLASLNASLVWFNLIPLLILDGQKFAQAIFASLSESGDHIAANIISWSVMLAGLGLILAGKLGLFCLLVFYGIRRESTKDDPGEAYSRKAMATSDAKWLIAVYIIIMVSTMVTSAFLPLWTV